MAIQPSLEFGRRLKRRGQDAVESHDPTFQQTMRAVARRLALEHGNVTGDDLRKWAADRGIQPKHPNAWGAVFRERGWQCVGYVQSAVVSRHAGRIGVWKWNPE